MVSSSHAGPIGSSTRPVRYELLTLGDELLLGLTANGHLTFIGSQLGRHGALLQRNVTITDEADAIAAQLGNLYRALESRDLAAGSAAARRLFS